MTPTLTTETVEFHFPSVEETVREYAEDFGPFLMARRVLEPQGRWDEFLGAYGDLVRAFNQADDGTALLHCEYFVITVEP